ncbi:MAG TPA: flagellar basal body rod C-terminal domain-containing protein, partial [Candidatus Polarisedimenticolia bacterium]|nr:flagellar basal body rod C-terminal domain-containing protein [Candidatus Polarisedimenticolia bacterium]
TLRILAGADGTDITDRQRGGRLGARLGLRDDTIPASLGELDSLAADLTTRANALTTAATDLQGNAGTALFVPDPPAASGAAGSIAVNAALLSDPTLLAVSTSGAPGEGSAAAALAALPDQASVALGGKSAAAFLADGLARIGNSVARADVDQGVAQGVVDGLTGRRDAVSGVSLDEEGLEVMRNQKAFEAAARFMQVMDSVTSTAVAMFKS